jgi:hypothetical protein
MGNCDNKKRYHSLAHSLVRTIFSTNRNVPTARLAPEESANASSRIAICVS